MTTFHRGSFCCGRGVLRKPQSLERREVLLIEGRISYMDLGIFIMSDSGEEWATYFSLDGRRKVGPFIIIVDSIAATVQGGTSTSHLVTSGRSWHFVGNGSTYSGSKGIDTPFNRFNQLNILRKGQRGITVDLSRYLGVQKRCGRVSVIVDAPRALSALIHNLMSLVGSAEESL